MNETTLKQFYQLSTLEPTDFNADSTKIVDFEYDVEDLNKQYDILQKLIDSSNSNVRNSVKTRKDDEEPLGLNESMVEELLEKDVIEDSRDVPPEKYFVSEKGFDVDLYLVVHNDLKRSKLISRLDYLEKEIALRQDNLNGVLHDEFVRFVTIKNILGDTMDRFYKEGSSSGLDVLGENLSLALKESDNVLLPLVQAKEKESMLKMALNFISTNKFIFNLPHTLQNDIKTKNYDSLVYDYDKGKYQYTMILNSLEEHEVSDSNVLLINKVWAEVDHIINDYKKSIWDKLNNVNIDNLNPASYNISININNEHNFIALIYKLLELNVEDNPITEFINIQFYKLQLEIEDVYQDYLKNISLSQANILSTYSLESTSSLSFLIRSISDTNHMKNDQDLTSDLPLVNEQWNLIKQFIANFTALMRKISKFGSIVDFVINGDFRKQHKEYASKRKNDYQDSNSIEKHLSFQDYEITKIRNQNEQLILKICDNLIDFFDKDTNEFQKSQLYSPEEISQSPLQYGFLPHFTNSITASIQNLRIYEVLSGNFQELVASKTSTPDIRETLTKTCIKINQALQLSVLTLLINDMKFSYNLNLENTAVNLIDLIELYYSNFIKRASNLCFQITISNDFKIQPSKNLLRNYEMAFLQSLNLLIESNLQKKLVTDDKLSKFTTLTNYYKLKRELKNEIILKYDQFFHTNIGASNLDIYSTLDNLELEIFDNLTSPMTKEITTIFNSRSSELLIDSPSSVSSVIKEIISIIVSTKVECYHLKISQRLVIKILSRLINHALLKIQDFIQSEERLFQIMIDLKYFETYFSDFIRQNDSSVKLINRIYGIISNKVNLQKAASQIENIVYNAVQNSRIELD